MKFWSSREHSRFSRFLLFCLKNYFSNNYAYLQHVLNEIVGEVCSQRQKSGYYEIFDVREGRSLVSLMCSIVFSKEHSVHKVSFDYCKQLTSYT